MKMANDFSSLNEEIREIKSELNMLNTEKESWFSKKEAIQKEISSLIVDIKKLRSNHSSNISPINESNKNKSERDKENAIVQELIKKIKFLNDKKTEIMKKNKIKDNPERLFKLIESLESQIETEAMSFNKEKEIMKKINSLKKQYSQFSELNSLFEEYNSLSKQIIDHKEKASQFHNLMRKSSHENKEENSKILKLSKKIILLRKEKQEAINKFLEYKQKFKEKNDLLKQKLALIGEQKSKKIHQKQRNANQNVVHQESLLNKKIEQVEQKIKKKEKLTTEDLLAFQKKS